MLITMPGKNLFQIDTKKSIKEKDIWTTEGKYIMKFDVIFMNPPYQSQSGESLQSKPIYQEFIEQAIDKLKPNYILAITPSRWMSGGMGLENFRKRMMNDKRIRTIVHFPGEREVFPNVSIKGGVSYFLWDSGYSGECEFIHDKTSTKRNLNENDIILQDNNAVNILKKVKQKTEKMIGEKVSSINPFLKEFSSTPSISCLLYSDYKKNSVRCYSSGKIIVFADEMAYFNKEKTIDKWKVATSKAAAEGASFNKNCRRHISSLFTIEPGSICTETYIIINTFNTKEESENFISYVKTKFFRFMLGLRLLTQNISKEKFNWVPDLQNYSKSYTDVELYDIFNLTTDERLYIENKIKEFI